MITITEKAVAKLKEIAEEQGIGHTTVRVGVKGGGCAGFTYDMYFDEKGPTDLDEIVEQDGVKVIVDPVSFSYIENVNIDFVEGLMGTGFKFNNPDVKASCGCGHSFDA